MREHQFSARRAAAASHYHRQRDYWLDRLSGEPVKVSLPPDYRGAEPSERRVEGLRFEFGDELSSGLHRTSNDSHPRLYMLLVTGLTILLYKYTGLGDIIVGAPISRQAEAGEYINNILALRNQLHGETTFKALLLQVRQTLLEAVENQNYPLETLLYQLDIPLSPSGCPLFDVAVLLESIHDRAYIRDIDVNLTFSFSSRDNTLGGVVEFNSLLYRRGSIERALRHLEQLLRRALKDVDVEIDCLDVLSQEERRQLLTGFNRPGSGGPASGAGVVTGHVEAQAARSPARTAVRFNHGHLTYRCLNGGANHLAGLLAQKGIQTGQIAGVMVPPSAELLVGILAVLKAGAAYLYLPTEAEYPRNRLHFMLRDGAVALLLVSPPLPGGVEFAGQRLLVDGHDGTNREPPRLKRRLRPDHLAYVVYTSGTTGRPKGILVNHESLANYTAWFSREAGLTAGDKSVLASSFAFDLGYTAVYPTIVRGGELHLVSREVYWSADSLLSYIVRNRITFIKLTPALFSVLVASPGFGRLAAGHLRLWVLGGEKINVADVAYSRHAGKQAAVMNHYGPAEAAVGCAAQWIDFSRFEDYCRRPTVGRPIDHTGVYILDRNLKVLPIGAAGEVCIAGKGLARGYLNRPELTAEKFVGNPFARGGRLYRSGDLGKWLEHGSLELLGRLDRQVKIRGYRVEPEEIAAHLLRHDAVKEAVVLAIEAPSAPNDGYLCAYIVQDGAGAQPAALKAYLSAQLPDYMVPTFFVSLDVLPLTANGKVNRKRLPPPEIGGPEEAYVPPGDELEEQLVQIWSEVLKLDRAQIGIDADFFGLGGHSLRATILMSKIHRALVVQIPLVEIFKTPTVRGLSQWVKRAAAESYTPLKPGELREYYPVSAAQQRLYLIQQARPEDRSYNTPVVMRIEGELHRGTIEEIFPTLIQRHEVLRSFFVRLAGEVVQRVLGAGAFKMAYCESSEQGAESVIRDFMRPFDLGQAPLLRAGLIGLSAQRHILVVDMHQIIADGTSIGVMVKEFMHLYRGESLARPRLQYRDYVQWRRRQEDEPLLKRQQAYWLAAFVGEVPLLNLPADFERPPVHDWQGGMVNFSLEGAEIEALERLAGLEGATLFMALLSIFYILLARLSRQSDIVVGTPMAGRRHADLQSIIGLFRNFVPLRICAAGGCTFRQLLRAVKEKTLEAFANQDYAYEDLADRLCRKGGAANRNPLFDAFISMQNFELPDLELPGMTLSRLGYGVARSRYDLSLYIMRRGRYPVFGFEYSTHLFRAGTVENYISYYRRIVSAVLAREDIRLAEIELNPHDE